MRLPRWLVGLTAINLILLMFVLTEMRISIGAGGLRIWTNVQGATLRGRALEIIDDEGRVRASIAVHPADPVAAPAGSTAILRLVDEDGRPSMKLATTQNGAGLLLLAEQGTYVQLNGHGLAVTKDGQRQEIP
jgi:hypothetical protein